MIYKKLLPIALAWALFVGCCTGLDAMVQNYYTISFRGWVFSGFISSFFLLTAGVNWLGVKIQRPRLRDVDLYYKLILASFILGIVNFFGLLLIGAVFEKFLLLEVGIFAFASFSLAAFYVVGVRDAIFTEEGNSEA